MKLTKFKKLNFQSYKPGKYEIPSLKKTKKIIKLSANESALGVSSKVKKILRNKISTSKYPDYTSKLLRKQISNKFKCNANKVICGSGSDEIIQMLCQLRRFVAPRKSGRKGLCEPESFRANFLKNGQLSNPGWTQLGPKEVLEKLGAAASTFERVEETRKMKPSRNHGTNHFLTHLSSTYVYKHASTYAGCFNPSSGVS